jgi:hypothetical protein
LCWFCGRKIRKKHYSLCCRLRTLIHARCTIPVTDQRHRRLSSPQEQWNFVATAPWAGCLNSNFSVQAWYRYFFVHERVTNSLHVPGRAREKRASTCLQAPAFDGEFLPAVEGSSCSHYCSSIITWGRSNIQDQTSLEHMICAPSEEQPMLRCTRHWTYVQGIVAEEHVGLSVCKGTRHMSVARMDSIAGGVDRAPYSAWMA